MQQRICKKTRYETKLLKTIEKKQMTMARLCFSYNFSPPDNLLALSIQTKSFIFGPVFFFLKRSKRLMVKIFKKIIANYFFLKTINIQAF
jgi:hypothetical protein